MSEPKDHLKSFLKAEPDDVKHFGIKGMRWGIRQSTTRGSTPPSSATPKGASSSKSVATVKPHDHLANPGLAAMHHEESSSSRYSRLASQAKLGQAKHMSDQDLKFFNARTDALAKVKKMNEVKPGWLSSTTKEVAANAAKRQMQTLANGLADKYVSTPILKAATGSATLPKDTSSGNGA